MISIYFGVLNFLVQSANEILNKPFLSSNNSTGINGIKASEKREISLIDVCSFDSAGTSFENDLDQLLSLYFNEKLQWLYCQDISTQYSIGQVRKALNGDTASKKFSLRNSINKLTSNIWKQQDQTPLILQYSVEENKFVTQVMETSVTTTTTIIIIIKLVPFIRADSDPAPTNKTGQENPGIVFPVHGQVRRRLGAFQSHG